MSNLEAKTLPDADRLGKGVDKVPLVRKSTLD